MRPGITPSFPIQWIVPSFLTTRNASTAWAKVGTGSTPGYRSRPRCGKVCPSLCCFLASLSHASIASSSSSPSCTRGRPCSERNHTASLISSARSRRNFTWSRRAGLARCLLPRVPWVPETSWITEVPEFPWVPRLTWTLEVPRVSGSVSVSSARSMGRVIPVSLPGRALRGGTGHLPAE